MSDGLLSTACNGSGVARKVAHLRVACTMVEFGELTTESVGAEVVGNDCKCATIVHALTKSVLWHCYCF